MLKLLHRQGKASTRARPIQLHTHPANSRVGPFRATMQLELWCSPWQAELREGMMQPKAACLPNRNDTAATPDSSDVFAANLQLPTLQPNPLRPIATPAHLNQDNNVQSVRS